MTPVRDVGHDPGRRHSPIVVGYAATATGRDALTLGIALARRQNVSLHLVLVAPEDTGFQPLPRLRPQLRPDPP